MYVEARITCADLAQASTIARRLVDDRLAACVHLSEVESCYRWQGAITTEREVLLTATTRADVFDELSAVVREMHSYEIPQITLVEIRGGSEAYLRWIDESVKAPKPAP